MAKQIIQEITGETLAEKYEGNNKKYSVKVGWQIFKANA